MPPAFTDRARARSDHASRLGITGRLLAGALLSLLLALAAVQGWTLYSVQVNGLRQARHSLDASMRALRHELAPLGTTWRVTSDNRLWLGTTLLNGRIDAVDAVKDVTGAYATIFCGDLRIATNIMNDGGQRATGTRLARGPVYDAVLRDGHSYGGVATILGARYLTLYEPIRDPDLRTIGVAFVGVPLADAEAFATRIARDGVIATAIVLILAGALYFRVLRATVRPLRELTGVMHDIAEDASHQAVPYQARADEIGQMARALLRLRDASAQARELEAAANVRAREETAKHAALIGMVEKVEAETTNALADVGSRTAAMTANAEKMAASAMRTGMSASSAEAASGQALAGAQVIAGSADLLSESIRHIGAQVEHSNAVVVRAVAAGDDTRATMEALHTDVNRIGAVVDLIGDVAAKTNLLALNATIEAARAGDAGKGFAVVASEVKALATQTARSTREIAEHIAQIRGTTAASVAAVAQIEQSIEEINGIARSIAESVQAQASATAEIVRNITETASAANQVVTDTTGVAAEAEETGRRAIEVCNDASGLNESVADLRHAVIRVLRTTTDDLDRRSGVRHTVDMPCRLAFPGTPVCEARVTDISNGGARIVGGPPAESGVHGILHLDAAGLALPCSVRSHEDDVTHLMFHPDSTVAAALQSMIEHFAGRAAA